jgi:ribulose-5-phosphate 4-epimerase/fuculose-1-phosphate aldolase
MLTFAGLAELNSCRSQLRSLGWLGVNADGIGYGNISWREGTSSAFFITAAGTGSKSELEPADCSKVVAYDLARNWLRCEGPMASSESLTHAAIYESDASVRAIIHCHSLPLWEVLRAGGLSTPPETEYGTAAMGYAVRHLFESSDVAKQRIFAMAGHREGVIAFGQSLTQALTRLLAHERQIA